MCLAVPARIVQVSESGEAVADMHGNRVIISTALLLNAAAGDWVLLHAGFAIQKLNPQEAQATFAVLADIAAADAEAQGGAA